MPPPPSEMRSGVRVMITGWPQPARPARACRSEPAPSDDLPCGRLPCPSSSHVSLSHRRHACGAKEGATDPRGRVAEGEPIPFDGGWRRPDARYRCRPESKIASCSPRSRPASSVAALLAREQPGSARPSSSRDEMTAERAICCAVRSSNATMVDVRRSASRAHVDGRAARRGRERGTAFTEFRGSMRYWRSTSDS